MGFMGAAAIGGGASLLSGFMGSSSADKAAKAQAAAAAAQLAESRRQYDQNRADLAPYRDIGTSAGNMLTAQLPDLTAPWQPTQANLEATPGYQFTRDQGLKATQNSAAARGLGLSGAAMKGAANYATGLADNTWQNVFNADQAQKGNAYNKLLGTTSLGASAAGATVGAGNTTTSMINNALGSQGQATAGGILGSTGQIQNALTGFGNSAQQYAMYNAMQNGGGLFGGGSNNLMALSGGANSGNGWSLFGNGGGF
jgi:hypothetical protein